MYADAIANCFRHAGFTDSTSDVQDTDTPETPQDSELEDFTRHACLLSGTDPVNSEEYTTIDDAVATSSIMTDEEIAAEVRQEHQPAAEDDESDNDEGTDCVLIPPSKAAVRDAFNTLHRHFLSRDPSGVQVLLDLEKASADALIKKQSTLKDYFNPA